ncbi:MAG: TrkH family potassium uptake protein [Actinomycetota bacterium]|nr:TrkH family potassium uptake protein [Actinomycetota bacterium]
MLLRPRKSDFKIIGYYIGKVIITVGLLMFIPLVVGLLYREWNACIDFIVGATACFLVGYLLVICCRHEAIMSWMHGMVVASVSWIIAMVVGALPHFLSGHFGSYLDACFDIMSGCTTTGLYLLQDLDHISYALNTWRHLLTYVGGQGIIVIALTFLVRGTGLVKMYVGEAKEEQLLPNVINTARAIWFISLTYLFLGSLVLWIAAMCEGIPMPRAFLHGIWLFMGAWSTGGFAPQSQNLLYYHSLLIEILTLIIFVMGSFNFAVHYAIWTGNRREIYRNIELLSFSTTLIVLFVLVTAGLMKTGIYSDATEIFRKGFYILVSGHTTTGNQTIYGRQFIEQWGPPAMLATCLAMAIGASTCSTAGGIKGLRVGIVFKALVQDIKRVILPESALVVERIHHIKEIVLDERIIRSAVLITLLYVLSYIFGALVGIYCGYPPFQALFDAVSAGSNTGLSCGVTSPNMPALMKVTYIFQMWAGRMEFVSVFALIGFIVSGVRGK